LYGRCTAAAAAHTKPPLEYVIDILSPSPRERGEGWGEGRFFEFAEEHLKNAVEILHDVVVPNADDAITERA
jgi:hypothetical protein